MAIPGFGEVAEQLRRSTVLVHSGGRGAGSGVIWSSDGLVVTNAHVVRGSRVHVQLWDGREFEAAIRSRDPRRDLARLHIDAANLPAASAADSSELRPGELAIAVGNPMGFIGALATGVIHAVGPLRGLARPIAALLAPGGRVILSGLLAAQANAALAAYLPQGLALERRIGLEGWMTLILRRRA